MRTSDHPHIGVAAACVGDVPKSFSLQRVVVGKCAVFGAIIYRSRSVGVGDAREVLSPTPTGYC